MDPDPAQSDQRALDEADRARHVWQHLGGAGIPVPEHPEELDLAHLVLAEVLGVDVGALLDATPLRSPQAA